MTQDVTLSLTRSFTNTATYTLSVLSMFGESIGFALSATIPEEGEEGVVRVHRRLNKEGVQVGATFIS